MWYINWLLYSFSFSSTLWCYNSCIQTYPITVGGGGAGRPSATGGLGTNGTNSIFSTITSTGGGAGGGASSGVQSGNSGGSGGGAGGTSSGGSGGAGNTPPVSPPQGQPGSGSGPNEGAGGGGASAAGSGKTGGNGVSTSITGGLVFIFQEVDLVVQILHQVL
jgi:hypothetical protein